MADERPSWKTVAITLAFACLFIWVTWNLYGEFEGLEAGTVKSMKVWAPIAWLYNLGGIWSSLAKWTAILGFGALAAGASAATVYNVVQIFTFRPEPPPSEPPASDGDAHVTVHVTEAQIRGQEEIAVDSPGGPVRLQLPASVGDGGLLRLRGQGVDGGDLYVHVMVRPG